MYSPYLQPSRPALPPDYYGTIQQAHERFIEARVEEILNDPKDLADAFAQYVIIKPTQCGQALKNCAGQGTVGHMLELDDLLKKAAECMADDEWSNRK